MKKIQVLDCTLRDGGYCNDCHFGFENEKRIINSLSEANIDIIECGFLLDTIEYNREYTRFNSVEDVSNIIPKNKFGKLFVLLTDHGKFDPKLLPNCDGKSVDGLRIAFHKKDWIAGLEDCRIVKEKGYKVFVQAMVSLSYSDEEFLDLIYRVNEIEPYAFYIVDSFGVMKRKDLTRLFYLVEHNLKDSICIGFHSHNNMQLSYSNAQSLVEKNTCRKLIIDSSIYGMGRGAGNLNTELFVEYLNDIADGNYSTKPLLNVIDEILNVFYERNRWGFSLPNYLSAKHNTHPNYAGYLDAKKTLTVESMDEIFAMMDENRRVSYDKNYIEELYTRYMATGEVQEKHLNELKERVYGKNVLIIAPGKSSIEESRAIAECAKQNADVSISINFDYSCIETDFIFLSNLRRYRELPESKRKKCIITSNVSSVDCYLKTKYADLLNDIEAVRDNAGMMLIQLLINLGAKKVYIAGIDGYSTDVTQNFAYEKMNFYAQKAVFTAMNQGLTAMLKNFADIIDIEYVTTVKHVVI